jgi:phage FluMu protein Com
MWKMPPRVDSPPVIDTHESACELRCDCGSLLAKLVGAFVELKCRRCKRTRRIAIERTSVSG